jgi:hypothetical protein
MRVLRAVRFLIPFLLVAVLVVAVVSVFSARPDLQNAKRNVSVTWHPLADELARRYLFLAAANQRVQPLPGTTRALADDVNAALARWKDARDGGSLTEQVDAANQLEDLGRRLVATAGASARVQGDAAAKAAVAKFATDRSFTGSVAFDSAVSSYHKQRQGPLRHLVATALGYKEIPAYAPPVPPST